MAASIEESLAKILEAMEGIKDRISDLEARNMRLQQSPTPLPPDTAHSPLSSVKDRWIASDIGFFDPHFNGRSVDTAEAIEHSDKDTYYRDVFVFLDRIKDYAETRSPELVRQNLSSCLRGTALAWYATELIAEAKTELRTGPGIENWTARLQARFRQRANRAMAVVARERYTLDDARRRREPREYASTILRAAQAALLGDTFQHLNIIYNGLCFEFQRDLVLPAATTNLESFLQEMDDHKDHWWAVASKDKVWKDFRGAQLTSTTPGPRLYASSTNPYYKPRSYQPQGQASYANIQFPPPAQAQGQTFQRNVQYPSSAQAPTPPLALPSTACLQIASEPYNQASAPNSTNPFRPRKRFESNQVTNRDKIRQPASYFHEDNLDTLPEQESPSEEANDIEDLDINEPEEGSFSYYLDEEGYHIGADIIPAPLHQFPCLVCNVPFPSKNLLHRHLRSCLPPLPANQLDQVLRYNSKSTDVFLSNAELVQQTPRVIPSQAMPSSSPGLGFRSWHYATVYASLQLHAKSDAWCIDSGCTMSLIDREYLKLHLPNFPISQSSQPITVRGIGDRRHPCSEYVALKIYIAGKDDKGIAVAQLQHAIHIVDDLRAKVLIGMDILGPEEVVMDIGRRKMRFPQCGQIVAPLTITPKSTEGRVDRLVRSAKRIIVPPFSIKGILVNTKPLPANRDYLFQPHPRPVLNLGLEGGVFKHVIDASFHSVLVRNATQKPISIPARAKLGKLYDYNADGCYLADPSNAHLAANSSWKQPKDTNLELDI